MRMLGLGLIVCGVGLLVLCVLNVASGTNYEVASRLGAAAGVMMVVAGILLPRCRKE